MMSQTNKMGPNNFTNSCPLKRSVFILGCEKQIKYKIKMPTKNLPVKYQTVI